MSENFFIMLLSLLELGGDVFCWSWSVFRLLVLPRLSLIQGKVWKDTFLFVCKRVECMSWLLRCVRFLAFFDLHFVGLMFQVFLA